MKKMILTLALSLFIAVGVNAQNAKGDWYVGTGDRDWETQWPTT